MIIIKFIETVLFIASIIFLFINWKIAITLFIIALFFNTIPFGPYYLLRTLTGSLVLLGIIFLFFNWKVGLLLLFGSYIVARFCLWINKVSNEYYSKNPHPLIKQQWEEFKKLNPDDQDRELVIKMINDFMIPDNISTTKFLANYQILQRGSRELYKTYAKFSDDPDYSQVGTYNIDKFAFIGDRPLGYEAWFIAAYPDVVNWLNNLEDEEIANLRNVNELDEEEFLDKNHKFKFEYLRKIVSAFKTTKGQLECV